ncbi:MAG: HlyD family efflux transporter periplasmic adaptor subunit [Ktedonobacteraceae bacterium]|nr:HlyD family efflux transporter periplasmic adaptor subunit [Ktedonobacteraceae bacterium]
MRRLILVPLLLILAVFSIAGGTAYYIYDNYLYYRTDDALVSGNIVPISAPANGQLTTLSVKQGDKVSQGQTIATVTATTSATATAPARETTINVTSPISGVILQIPAVQGQNVAAGLAIAQMTNLDTLNITAYVDEGQISNVKPGQDVDIHIDAFSDTSFTGKTQQIVQATAGSFSLLPVEDNASGNFTKVSQRIPVIISIDSASSKNILPGMSASVAIHIH